MPPSDGPAPRYRGAAIIWRKGQGLRLAQWVLAVLVLLISCPALAQAQAGEQPICQRLIVVTDTPLQSTPSSTAAAVSALPAGTLVWRDSITATAGITADWQQVRYAADGADVTGWVSADVLREVALLVVRTGVALRAAPDPEATFVQLLPPAAEVWSFGTEMVNGQTWQHVWTADGVTGWAAAGQFDAYRVIAPEPLALLAWPGDEATGVTLEASIAAVVMEITPEGGWLRLQTPQGDTGWAAAGAIRPVPIAAHGQVWLPQAVRSHGANLRSGPSTDSPVIGRILHDTPVPVVGRDESAAWLLVIDPRGRLAWISSDRVRLERGVVQWLDVVASP